MCALPLGIAAERSIHNFWDYFGQIEVKVLPLGIAAESTIFGIIFQLSCIFLGNLPFPQKGLS